MGFTISRHLWLSETEAVPACFSVLFFFRFAVCFLNEFGGAAV
jgi:hypothetical protein